MKNAIIVLSDLKNGSEEALGRVFMRWPLPMTSSRLATTLLFQGAGTRWAGELAKQTTLPTTSTWPLKTRLWAYPAVAPMFSVPAKAPKQVA